MIIFCLLSLLSSCNISLQHTMTMRRIGQNTRHPNVFVPYHEKLIEIHCLHFKQADLCVNHKREQCSTYTKPLPRLWIPKTMVRSVLYVKKTTTTNNTQNTYFNDGNSNGIALLSQLITCIFIQIIFLLVCFPS